MKVCVGIPSYNEADRISFVTEQVDKGISFLKSKFPQVEEGIIINSDNDSRDNTRDQFLTTKTENKKLTFVTKGKPGKGKNVLAILRYAVENNFDIVLTIDSDLQSITPEWILKFGRLVIDKVDFVYPDYKRNRFEGSTTNHFAYPFIYAFFGKDIRQPIGGDFAMSLDFAKHILEKETPLEARHYGIDIFLSMSAAANGFRVSQVTLDKKIHKPSFPRMREMFPQVAASALDTARQYQRADTFDAVDQTHINIVDNTVFSHVNEAGQIRLEEIDKILKLIENDSDWLANDTLNKLSQILPDDFRKFESADWLEIFSAWLIYGLAHKDVNAYKHALELLPFFVLRAVNFWDFSESQTALAVEAEIRQQALAFKKLIDNNL